MPETNVVAGQDIFLDVTNKLVDMLEQGFQPRYVILGGRDYARLVVEAGGVSMIRLGGLDIVVDPEHEERIEVVPRADYWMRYAQAREKA